MTSGARHASLSRLQRVRHRARLYLWKRGSYDWLDRSVIRLVGLGALIRHTNNFSRVTWLGRPVWQNLADVWTIQEVIVDRDVDLVVECGTNRGGSAFFMASLFDLLGRGHVITVDIAGVVDFEHPRIDFLVGSSVDPVVVERIQALVAARAPREVLVILDSDHSAAHVREEMRLYAGLIPVGGYMIVQDECIDEVPMMAADRPGPLVAIKSFLSDDDRFEPDHERSMKYLFHHASWGCLRRVR